MICRVTVTCWSEPYWRISYIGRFKPLADHRPPAGFAPARALTGASESLAGPGPGSPWHWQVAGVAAAAGLALSAAAPADTAEAHSLDWYLCHSPGAGAGRPEGHETRDRRRGQNPSQPGGFPRAKNYRKGK